MAKKDEAGLCIKWRPWKDYDYINDVFSSDFFVEETQSKECSHGERWNDQSPTKPISCLAEIRGDYACLTYPEYDDSSVRIYFASEQRREVVRIDWVEPDGKVWMDDADSNWHVPETVEEGNERTREAWYLSRNSKLVTERKRIDNSTCQACGYQRERKGKAIIDVHHLKPLSGGARVTKIADLVCLCPNCHRLAHTSPRPLTVKQLKNHLTKL